MTSTEFSNGFATLLNSSSMKAAFGDAFANGDIVLNEYEKSIFLTNAQEETVLSIYNGRNPTGIGFEGTEEMRRYLSNLVSDVLLTPITTMNNAPLGVSSNSRFFTLPDGSGTKPAVWFITYEAVNVVDTKDIFDDKFGPTFHIKEKHVCPANTVLKVVPTTQDEYHTLRNNPFRGANDYRALRMDLADGVVEIICKHKISTYYVRYLRRPKPIILEDLPDGLSIEGKVTASSPACELSESLHQRILERAVLMAIQSKVSKSIATT